MKFYPKQGNTLLSSSVKLKSSTVACDVKVFRFSVRSTIQVDASVALFSVVRLNSMGLVKGT